MQFHKEEKRLKDSQEALESRQLHFGPTKEQELIRLLYEVSKRDNISPKVLLKKAVENNRFPSTKQAFVYLKDYFLKRRFPSSYKNNSVFSLPKVDFNPMHVVIKNDSLNLQPETIYIEKDIEDCSLTRRILRKFPFVKKITFTNHNDCLRFNRNGSPISNYNLRAKTLFLIKERYDFIKPCPCSKDVIGCGHYVLNTGFGCISECSYCFLQNYTNAIGITLPVNIEDFLDRLESFLKTKQGPLRIGTGEFIDSLALDDLTGFSSILIDFFSKAKNATLELKTKSNNIKNILKLKHNKKTVISWSLNPQSIIEADEWRTNNLDQRLKAARECCDAGYLVGFHFDPIIYSANWERLYRELVAKLFNKINPNNIAWISLGTFRFTPKLKTIVEQRFPKSKILDEELMLGFDKKLRYSPEQRVRIYKKMFSWIRDYSDSVLVYLCMEPEEIWKAVLGKCRF